MNHVMTRIHWLGVITGWIEPEPDYSNWYLLCAVTVVVVLVISYLVLRCVMGLVDPLAPVYNVEQESPAVVNDDTTDEEVTVLIDAANANPVADLATTGRKLARRCGLEIRAAMGCPTYSNANRIIATQRCQDWLKTECPSLRRSVWEFVLQNAVVVALTPTREEVDAVTFLQSRAAFVRRHHVESIHQIPRYDYNHWLQWWFGWTIPAVQSF